MAGNWSARIQTRWASLTATNCNWMDSYPHTSFGGKPPFGKIYICNAKDI